MTAPGANFRDVSRLLEPRSIAVIGASEQAGNLGGVAIRLLRKFGYPGAIHPVNPGRSEVHGLPCRARIGELPAPPDLAIIATGPAAIPALVRECAAAGTRFGIVWSGGFAEIGGEGRDIQDALTRACAETGFMLMGPNCIGVINSWLPMTASFASFLLETDELARGDISMVSQSGGTATMGQALAQQAGFGFRYMISSGNEAVLTAADYIHALAQDRHTKIIAAYLEGVGDGDRFIAALRAARDAGKPVVVLKGGATMASARAAAAHTGALVGEARVWDAIFRAEGVIQARSLEQLLDIVLFLSSADPRRLPRGRGVAVVTFGGGGGVLSADQCAHHGLATPRLAEATRERLRPLVPPIAAIDNPIDLTPQAFNQERWLACFSQALAVIASDPEVNSVLLQFGPMGQRGMEIAREICDFRDRADKAVCIAWSLAPRGVPELLRGRGVFNFTEYERAIAVLGLLARRAAAAAAPARAVVAPASLDWAACVPAPAAGMVICEHDCHRILAAAGLAVAPGRLARSAAEAIAAARAVGPPVAMKGISPAVTHRAAAGLLSLGLRSDEEIREAHGALTKAAAAAGVALDGVYVQRMIEGGLEVLVSAFRDPVFGVMIACGSGGALTELIDDVVLERAPLDDDQALAMIERMRLTRGARNLTARPDARLLAGFVARFSRVAASAPWRRFVLEVNPVKWRQDGVAAVDGLLIIELP